MNTTIAHGGRFGNLFFVGIALSFISKNNNLLVSYKNGEKLKEFGIDLFTGNKTYETSIELKDENFMKLIIGQPILKNITIQNNVWCQTKEFAVYLKDYFNIPDNKNAIMKANRFKERYNSNNDVFVHIRLGDIIGHYNQPFKYYDKVLSSLKFENGYYSSDSIDHPICQKLSEKYNLKKIVESEEKTIMFGNTCKYLVLSGGTFSWMIGFFGFFSEVYYPKIHIRWHGDIFVFPEWKEIEY
jgi:hypothetical protein